MTPDTLRTATGCTAEAAALYAPFIVELGMQYGLSTPTRLAAFLAQVGHESGGFRYVREIASGAAYEGRKDLGNTQPGDGTRFRGRGLIQVTGRFNYRACAKALMPLGAPDFESTPEALEQPKWAVMSAGWYWDSRKLNELADNGRFERITRIINGGLNGQADRIRRWEKAKAVLLTDVPTTISQTTPEEPPVLPLLAVLGKTLIAALTPLAAEKISKEISRHTDDSAVSEQITTALVTAAQQATGLTDPVEAVAEARKNPAMMAQVEQSALEQLERMGPMLDRLAALNKDEWSAEEFSRDAAAARAKNEEFDMAKPLLYLAAGGVFSLIALVGGIIIAQVWQKGTPDTASWSALTGLIGWATGVTATIFAYRFGTTRNNTAKDVVIASMSRSRGPTQ